MSFAVEPGADVVPAAESSEFAVEDGETIAAGG